MPTGRYADIIERLRPSASEPGDIVDLDGRVLGRHDGIIHFTVGQRRGLGIAAGSPLYVVRLDAATRRVVVGPREALRTQPHPCCATSTGSATARSTDAVERMPGSFREGALDPRRRSRPGCARGRRPAIEVELIAGEDGVSPGQACVFYDAPQARRACSAAASSARSHKVRNGRRRDSAARRGRMR